MHDTYGRDQMISPPCGGGLIMVVSAPSGTGKTTICRELLKQVPGLVFCISHTTRPPRRGEADGRDYFFIGEGAFRERIARGEFIEWVENYGHLYGTSKESVRQCMAEGSDVLFDVEPHGAKELKRLYPEGVFVFMLPPSLAVLAERLGRRGSEGAGMMKLRTGKAIEEIREATWYDYIVTNDTISHTVAILHAIYVAEKNQGVRSQGKIKALFTEEV